MEKLKSYLEAHKLITDGAFGTYYSRVYDTNELPESVNITMADVSQIFTKNILILTYIDLYNQSAIAKSIHQLTYD